MKDIFLIYTVVCIITGYVFGLLTGIWYLKRKMKSKKNQLEEGLNEMMDAFSEDQSND